MRIAIFSDTYAPEVNGVARTLKRYTNYLDTKGIAYRLFVPEGRTPVPKVPHIERFMSIPFLLYPDCRLAIPNPIHIRQTLDEFKPTLIHVATPFNLGLFGLHYGKKHQIPMVASYHTHFDDYLAYYHATFLTKWIWKYLQWFHQPFDRVYVPSESTREKLLSRNFHPSIDIWGRGVNHHFYSPAKQSRSVREIYNIKEKNILLYVGRVAPEKDVHIVLETFHALPEHVKQETHLLIVGNGPLFQTLSAKEHPQITWTGFLEGEALSKVYASADLFLFPSPTETFGNVVLEAQSSGLPVIGAKAGGVQHLVTHGVNGFLCEAKHTESFANYTSLLLEQESLRRTFAEKSRAFALTLSWNEIFDKLINSFLQIANRKQEISA
ncbi:MULTISPECIES: glycosyltransferase family 4 protein [Paenibacillus]|uniref:Glycosyl transferase n=1 Tax=Paenibacillus campinasensis TaxID=66347 RepID=A0A268F234_9BACL|nr:MULTISPECIES: glycosyltransferase family 1 protein [Paenibacillus]MUG65867.1 glycosyltransferase [Paenibacillus campinasensis]PAD79394.1 glycosyl transferase [Paenibacillus campinasensis]PAK51663.1 glycosyl transferase [Paenibacillus sp. 7541]